MASLQSAKVSLSRRTEHCIHCILLHFSPLHQSSPRWENRMLCSKSPKFPSVGESCASLSGCCTKVPLSGRTVCTPVTLIFYVNQSSFKSENHLPSCLPSCLPSYLANPVALMELHMNCSLHLEQWNHPRFVLFQTSLFRGSVCPCTRISFSWFLAAS